MNLDLLTLFASPNQSQSIASTGSGNTIAPSGGSSSASSIGDIMFAQLLAAKLQNPQTAATVQNAAANVSQVRQLGVQLKATITQLLANGTSLEQIVNQIAQSLGSRFLSQLQTQLGTQSGTDVATTVNQLIAQALGPPQNANGPPAEQAAALVDRLMQVVETLTRVSTNATGQQLESLGTTVSDANAKDNPAPDKTTALLQAAIVALQPYLSSASPPSSNVTSSPPSGATITSNVPSPVAPPAPWVPTTTTASPPRATSTLQRSAGEAATAQIEQTQQTQTQIVAQRTDGPTVAADPILTMVGTGGDTVIGRILARAANVAATQAANQNQNLPPTGTATLQPQVAVSSADASSGGTTSDALLASLLKSLQTALASLPPPKTDSATATSGTDGQASGTSALAPTASAGDVFASLGIGPLVQTTVDPTTTQSPGSQSSTPTQPYVDPNAVVDQVLRGIAMRFAPDGTQTVRMRLVPESLGDVTVNLQVQNGSVTATLVAQNSGVRDALLANQQILTRSMADAGLKLASFTVNVSSGGQYQQPQYQPQPQFGTARRFNGIRSIGADDAVAAVPTFGPPQTQLAAMQWLNALA